MIKKKPKQPDNTGTSRNTDGTFPPGISGNPAGKPAGAISITALIKQKLLEEGLTKSGEKKTFILAFVESMLQKAITEGDHNTQKMIWNYIDGMPKGSLDLTTKGQKINSFDTKQISQVAREVLQELKDAENE